MSLDRFGITSRDQDRLRSNVFLKVLKDFGLDNCYRCKQPIKTSEELSIDHIEPWLGVSADLFWSVTNVAFSHRSCNSRARRPEFLIQANRARAGERKPHSASHRQSFKRAWTPFRKAKLIKDTRTGRFVPKGGLK